MLWTVPTSRESVSEAQIVIVKYAGDSFPAKLDDKEIVDGL